MNYGWLMFYRFLFLKSGRSRSYDSKNKSLKSMTMMWLQKNQAEECLV